MKIALFYVKNFLACHYALFGYRETLERMGHEVIDCPFPSNKVGDPRGVKTPSTADLVKCDLILSTYHEYVQPWLRAVYPWAEWELILAHVPVVARFDESMDRNDLQLPQRVPELLRWATQYSWPAAQDAEKFGGAWHPYGADTGWFYPHMEEPGTQRDIPIGFLGTLYDKRREYLTKLMLHVGSTTRFYQGNCVVQDVDGIHEKDTTARLAHNYRRMKIFFCLPPMSNLIVEKVWDVMACNTMVMFPRFYSYAAKNNSLFEDGKHIVYYDQGFFSNNGKQVKYYLSHPEEAAEIGRAGGDLVRTKYTLECLMQNLLDMAIPAKQDETAQSILVK